METNRQISHRIFASLPNAQAEKLIDITVDYIVHCMHFCDIAMFQSAFGFMNNDIPFTMIIKRNPNHNSQLLVSVDVNDWCIFDIEDDQFNPSCEWELCTPGDRAIVPEWRSMTALEIYDSFLMHTVRDVMCDNSDGISLRLQIKQMLMSIYVEDMRPCDWPCEIIKAHVAMIYSENYEKAKFVY